MKKILFSVALAATLCSCGGNANREYYFLENEVCVYNDPTAEFDTLSYALGMNLGLNLHIQQKDLGYINDIVCEAIEAEVTKPVVDMEFIKKNREEMTEFNNNKVRPYMMAKQIQSRKQFTDPEAADSIELPALFDDKFTAESVSKNLGHDMGNHLREVSYPANLYWIFKAFSDAEQLNGIYSTNDTTMMLKQPEVTQALRKYYTEQLLDINKERSEKWINNIAQKSDVQELVMGNDKLYYRIETPGNDVKIGKLADTVVITYEIFTNRGILVESTEDRANTVKKAIENIRKDESLSDSVRNSRIADGEEHLKKVSKPSMLASNLKLRGAQEALRLIGVGGEITIWMPANLAYGEDGNRFIGPNEALQMNIELLDVKTPNVQVQSIEWDTPAKDKK
jgi:FKBP-type peptidyl-prolyl cis-trans isomerase FkpA